QLSHKWMRVGIGRVTPDRAVSHVRDIDRGKKPLILLQESGVLASLPANWLLHNGDRPVGIPGDSPAVRVLHATDGELADGEVRRNRPVEAHSHEFAHRAFLPLAQSVRANVSTPHPAILPCTRRSQVQINRVIRPARRRAEWKSVNVSHVPQRRAWHAVCPRNAGRETQVGLPHPEAPEKRNGMPSSAAQVDQHDSRSHRFEEVAFQPSSETTVGIELELQVLDRDAGDLVPGAQRILDACAGEAIGDVGGEFLLSMIEVRTGVCQCVAEAKRQLFPLLRRVRNIASSLGYDLAMGGTHPRARPSASAIAADDRYQRIRKRQGWLAYEEVTFGL